MNNYLSREMIIYLFNVLGLDESTIELGIKLSIKNNTPLPILLWSYGMLTIEELDKLYSFLFQKMDFLLNQYLSIQLMNLSAIIYLIIKKKLTF